MSCTFWNLRRRNALKKKAQSQKKVNDVSPTETLAKTTVEQSLASETTVSKMEQVEKPVKKGGAKKNVDSGTDTKS